MTKLRRRIRKLIIWMLIVLIVLIISTGFYGYLKAEQTLNQKLSEWVDNESDHLYRLSFENLKLKLFPLTLVIQDINLTTNADAVTIPV